MNKSVKLALIVGITGIIIFVGLFAWREVRTPIVSKMPSNDLQDSVTSSPTSNNIIPQRETYGNPYYDIFFKYPKEWGKLTMMISPNDLSSMEQKAKQYKTYYTFVPQDKQIKRVWYYLSSKSLVFIKLGKVLNTSLGPRAQETLYIIKPDGKIVSIFTVPKDEVNIDCEIEFVNFSPNNQYIVFSEYCYEAECARIVNIKTKQDVLEINHLSLAKQSEVTPFYKYKDILWSPDSKVLAFKNYYSDFGGGSIGALYASDYGNPEKVNLIYKLSSEQHMGGSYFHDIQFLSDKVLTFSVYSKKCNTWPGPGESYNCSQPTDDRYEYNTISKELKKIKNETSNWKVFEDVTGLFFVKYPNDWLAYQETGGGVSFASNDNTIHCLISIYPTGIKKREHSNCGESFLNSYFPEGRDGYTLTRTNFTVDRTPVFQIKSSGQSIFQTGGGFDAWYIFGPSKKNSSMGFPVCFQAEVTIDSYSRLNEPPFIAKAEDNIKCIKTFSQILSTFKFIK